MDWTQAFTIIGATGAFVLWAYSKLDADIKNLSARMDQSNQRIDQLYAMFCQQQKDMDQKFYDLLKERK